MMTHDIEGRPIVRRQNAHPERDIQRSCIHWLRTVLPPGSIVAAIENERGLAWGDAMQRARYGANRKRSGVVAGVPDCFCALPGGRVLWLEFKAEGGRLSPAQKVMHEGMGRLGHSVFVVRSIEDCREVLLVAGVRTREIA